MKEPAFFVRYRFFCLADFKEYSDCECCYQKLDDEELYEYLCRRPALVFAHVVMKREPDVFKNLNFTESE